jgi:DNA-binding IclR family transcriptional regulator
VSEGKDRGSGMRTIALLKLIAESDNTFTLTKLATKASLPPSTVHRILQPFLRGGLVERTSGQAYRVGSEFFRIASLVLGQVDAGMLARPILRRLWSQWEETCSLCVYKPTEHIAVVVETIPTPHFLRFVIEPFAELSLTWGSLGHAILAALPPAEAEIAMQRPGRGPLSGLPPATPQEMMDVIAKVRTQGFAQYRNEKLDAAGVAAPVHRGDGTILGSIGITAPAQRLRPELVPPMATAVKAAAKELSEMLGYRE